ncbi:MAG: acetyl-CoA carboxylase biotin carboxylase subunit [Aestuariivirga sp.]
MLARPFRKLLIANRGEIACRIMRTARRMGIRTVAVYSDADRNALHTGMADEAHHIGPAPARESYLSIERIIGAARASGAEAIHPGYGFLSENADFADACEMAGLVFVGPPAEAMRAMGSKSAAKALMAASGVPLVPGYHGEKQDAKTLSKEADVIGYPVLIKASAGGGGKGMRIVHVRSDLAQALESARREAASAFGDDRVLIEKYLERPRHIEVQIFGDIRGNIVSLFERECTLQRRHQKVVEEAPSAAVTEARRETMMAAARAAAKAVGYVGAGTIEFIADAAGFYFIEMNTRLQVEHAVTEMITGLDLVEWQLRVAMGEALPLKQDQISRSGHAIECRIYAEDPEKGFLPSIGRLEVWRQPATGRGVRVDTGFRQGDEVSQHYDPMLAKLIVWGEDRVVAFRMMEDALSELHVAGVSSNAGFLQTLVAHDSVRGNAIDTGFIERELGQLTGQQSVGPLELAAAIAALLTRDRCSDSSPWSDQSGWMMVGERKRRIVLRDSHGGEHVAVLHYTKTGLVLDSRQFSFDAEDDGQFRISLDGIASRAFANIRGTDITIATENGRFKLSYADPFAGAGAEHAAGGHVISPMPGNIIGIHAKAGDILERGQPVLTLEAMKMEHGLKAQSRGKLIALRCAVGDFVQEGAVLAEFEAIEEQ